MLVIPVDISFRCSRLSGNKKAGTQMRTDFPQKDRPIPCGGGFPFMEPALKFKVETVLHA